MGEEISSLTWLGADCKMRVGRVAHFCLADSIFNVRLLQREKASFVLRIIGGC